jgi:hypothetical protein
MSFLKKLFGKKDEAGKCEHGEGCDCGNKDSQETAAPTMDAEAPAAPADNSGAPAESMDSATPDSDQSENQM